MQEDTRKSCLARLGRIEGQVRGIARMIEQDRYCIDVVNQIEAVKAALKAVESQVLQDHARHCVEHAIASGDAADQRAKLAELLRLLDRL